MKRKYVSRYQKYFFLNEEDKKDENVILRWTKKEWGMRREKTETLVKQKAAKVRSYWNRCVETTSISHPW